MSASRPLHILAIDDEPELRALYADLLEAEGYVVTPAWSPPPIAETVALRPDLILLDLVFDGSPIGWTYLDALADNDGARDIPVVLCSAAALDVRARADELRRVGVEVVEKPFDLDALLDVIRRCLPVDGHADAADPRRSDLAAG